MHITYTCTFLYFTCLLGNFDSLGFALLRSYK